MPDEEEDTRNYTVVINHDEQYSIWFQDREIPRGWVEVGVRGKKTECLDYIEKVWTDMRPLRVRWQLEELERTGGSGTGGSDEANGGADETEPS